MNSRRSHKIWKIIQQLQIEYNIMQKKLTKSITYKEQSDFRVIFTGAKHRKIERPIHQLQRCWYLIICKTVQSQMSL